MPLGKSIRIYLKDGTVTGIKFGEVVNQTIQSISCPRNRIAELSNYSEAKRPGIYFLFGFDEDTNEPKVYIGEAENVFTRLQDHLNKKGFWNEVIIFVSKDENLTKSHVRFLESRNIEIAFSTNRYKVDNYNQSQPSSLPPADKDAMEEFLNYVKLLLGVLGHKLLEEVVELPLKTQPAVNNPIPQANNDIVQKAMDQGELYLNVGGFNAQGLITDEGLVVLKGSQAAKDIQPSMPMGYRVLRDKLISSGVIKIENDRYVF